MEELDFSEIQEVLDQALGNGFQFQAFVEQAMEGGTLFSWQNFLSLLQNIFLSELTQQKSLWIHILLLTIAAAVLLHFSDIFQNKSVSQISFCMIYMILFLLLLSSFQNSMQITKDVLSTMRDFMSVLAPAYLLALTLTSYLTSAGVYYEFILLLISLVRWSMEHLVLPCIEIYVLLLLVNSLSKEARLSKLVELTEMVVGWGLKAILTFVMGFQMIQALISPAADAFRNTSISKGIEMIPGVGNIGGSMTEMVLGSAMLIKNGIGAAALFVLIFLCLIPLTKLGVIMLVYYLLAALLQPVSDERITTCLSGMGNGVRLLFKTVFTVLVLFLLTIALTTAVTR